MKRFVLYADLKPEKAEEYSTLHKNAWPELLEAISASNIHNYSISVRGTSVYTFYVYTGDDYEADSEKLNNTDVMQKWCALTRPCFLYHEEGKYYETLEEVFYLE